MADYAELGVVGDEAEKDTSCVRVVALIMGILYVACGVRFGYLALETLILIFAFDPLWQSVIQMFYFLTMGSFASIAILGLIGFVEAVSDFCGSKCSPKFYKVVLITPPCLFAVWLVFFCILMIVC